MSYTPTVYTNDAPPPLSAANANKWEAGLAAAAAVADSAAAAAAAATTLAGAMPRLMVAVYRVSGSWPARPTARTDITVAWIGADPSPAVVTSGTGGMLSGVDLRFVTVT